MKLGHIDRNVISHKVTGKTCKVGEPEFEDALKHYKFYERNLSQQDRHQNDAKSSQAFETFVNNNNAMLSRLCPVASISSAKKIRRINIKCRSIEPAALIEKVYPLEKMLHQKDFPRNRGLTNGERRTKEIFPQKGAENLF